MRNGSSKRKHFDQKMPSADHRQENEHDRT